MQREGTCPKWKLIAGLSVVLIMAGCSSVPRQPTTTAAKQISARTGDAPTLPPANSGRGGYYKDDGPGEQIPQGLENMPDAEPRVEPFSTRANRPYTVFGKNYRPITDNRPYKQRGIGSWYGKKFHGNKTSSGELYDMYQMTAAHPTLPIPSYVRVTKLDNGKQIIARVNDRGPFHSDRIIDLSYTAALKLGYLGKGSGMLEVELLSPEEIDRITLARRTPATDTLLVASMQDKSADKPVYQPVYKPIDRPVEINMQSYPALPVSLLEEKSATPLVVPTAGYYLQLGAYSQVQNAEAVRAQYALAWMNTLPPVEVVQKDVYYRLVVGPFVTREKAAEAAQLVQETGGAKPIIVQR